MGGGAGAAAGGAAGSAGANPFLDALGSLPQRGALSTLLGSGAKAMQGKSASIRMKDIAEAMSSIRKLRGLTPQNRNAFQREAVYSGGLPPILQDPEFLKLFSRS